MMSEIRFGTDGWRAVIGEDFTMDNVRRVATAIGRTYESLHPGKTVLVGFDTRAGADRFAHAVAEVLATFKLDVVVSDRYLPTPALCWAIAHDPDVCGGVMLTASHNPAQYLGIKLRMEDGGASPVTFTETIEQALVSDPPVGAGAYRVGDLLSPYLAALMTSVDGETIARKGLRVLVDPLYGAARGYLSAVLCALGVSAEEIHGEAASDFGGLHPEPIPPWTDSAAEKVVSGDFDAAFVTDGDADRLGAIDERGRFVNSHRIFTLLIAHLVEDLGMSGRVVRTVSGSELVKRQCERLGLELATTPIGFKWIYSEMMSGDVLIGGEESGGIGIPGHVRERDGLLMSLLLVQMMAVRGKKLGELVDEMLVQLGPLEYDRRDLALAPEVMARFVAAMPKLEPGTLGSRIVDSVVRVDGVKFVRDDGSWLLLRPSGTEPLVRVYAEAATADEVQALLDAGCDLIGGDRVAS